MLNFLLILEILSSFFILFPFSLISEAVTYSRTSYGILTYENVLAFSDDFNKYGILHEQKPEVATTEEEKATVQKQQSEPATDCVESCLAPPTSSGCALGPHWLAKLKQDEGDASSEKVGLRLPITEFDMNGQLKFSPATCM